MKNFIAFFKRVYHTKTFKLCVAGLAGIAQQYFTGQIDETTALAGVFFCLYGIFNRDAVIKSGPGA